MPKEAVYGSPLAFTDEDDARVAVVEVRWNRDTHVQVVSKCLHRTTGGEIVPEGTSSSATLLPENGFYVDLDRVGINDLIRHLRKARDQAFGRDE